MRLQDRSSEAEVRTSGYSWSSFDRRSASLVVGALLLGYGLVRRGWPGMVSMLAGAGAAIGATLLRASDMRDEPVLIEEREDVILQGEFDEGALSGAARAALLDFPYNL